MNDETLKEEIDTWIRQAYVNGSLDVNNPEPQGSDVCTELIMQLIKKDRERAVREARVDELKSIALVCRDLEDGEDPNDAVAIEVEHRIADLQSTIKTNQSI